MDGDPGGEHLIVLVIEQKTRPAGNCIARNRSDQVRDQRTADPGVKYHRHLSALDPARIQPVDRPGSGLVANFVERGQVFQMVRHPPGIVALHRPALPCNRGRANPMHGPAERSGKAVTGDQREIALRQTGMAAFGIGHTRHSAGGILHFEGAGPQVSRGKLSQIGHVEVGERAFEQQIFGGKTSVLILRRGAGHIDSARRQFLQRGVRQVA